MKRTKHYIVLLPIEVEVDCAYMRKWHRARVLARMKRHGRTDGVAVYSRKLGMMVLPMSWLYRPQN